MDSVKTDAELTSTVGNVLSTSNKEEKNDSSDATPTSSTDANTNPTASRTISEDPISSTSSDTFDHKPTMNQSIVDETDKGPSVDHDHELLEMNISNEKITEDVEDLVHDLESLLGETPSFNLPIKPKGTADHSLSEDVKKSNINENIVNNKNKATLELPKSDNIMNDKPEVEIVQEESDQSKVKIEERVLESSITETKDISNLETADISKNVAVGVLSIETIKDSEPSTSKKQVDEIEVKSAVNERLASKQDIKNKKEITVNDGAIKENEPSTLTSQNAENRVETTVKTETENIESAYSEEQGAGTEANTESNKLSISEKQDAGNEVETADNTELFKENEPTTSEKQVVETEIETAAKFELNLIKSSALEKQDAEAEIETLTNIKSVKEDVLSTSENQDAGNTTETAEIVDNEPSTLKMQDTINDVETAANSEFVKDIDPLHLEEQNAAKTECANEQPIPAKQDIENKIEAIAKDTEPSTSKLINVKIEVETAANIKGFPSTTDKQEVESEEESAKEESVKENEPSTSDNQDTDNKIESVKENEPSNSDNQDTYNKIEAVKENEPLTSDNQDTYNKIEVVKENEPSTSDNQDTENKVGAVKENEPSTSDNQDIDNIIEAVKENVPSTSNNQDTYNKIEAFKENEPSTSDNQDTDNKIKVVKENELSTSDNQDTENKVGAVKENELSTSDNQDIDNIIEAVNENELSTSDNQDIDNIIEAVNENELSTSDNQDTNNKIEAVKENEPLTSDNQDTDNKIEAVKENEPSTSYNQDTDNKIEAVKENEPSTSDNQDTDNKIEAVLSTETLIENQPFILDKQETDSETEAASNSGTVKEMRDTTIVSKVVEPTKEVENNKVKSDSVVNEGKEELVKCEVEKSAVDDSKGNWELIDHPEAKEKELTMSCKDVENSEVPVESKGNESSQCLAENITSSGDNAPNSLENQDSEENVVESNEHIKLSVPDTSNAIEHVTSVDVENADNIPINTEDNSKHLPEGEERVSSEAIPLESKEPENTAVESDSENEPQNNESFMEISSSEVCVKSDESKENQQSIPSLSEEGQCFNDNSPEEKSAANLEISQEQSDNKDEIIQKVENSKAIEEETVAVVENIEINEMGCKDLDVEIETVVESGEQLIFKTSETRQFKEQLNNVPKGIESDNIESIVTDNIEPSELKVHVEAQIEAGSENPNTAQVDSSVVESQIEIVEENLQSECIEKDVSTKSDLITSETHSETETEKMEVGEVDSLSTQPAEENKNTKSSESMELLEGHSKDHSVAETIVEVREIVDNETLTEKTLEKNSDILEIKTNKAEDVVDKLEPKEIEVLDGIKSMVGDVTTNEVITQEEKGEMVLELQSECLNLPESSIIKTQSDEIVHKESIPVEQGKMLESTFDKDEKNVAVEKDLKNTQITVQTAERDEPRQNNDNIGVVEEHKVSITKTSKTMKDISELVGKCNETVKVDSVTEEEKSNLLGKHVLPEGTDLIPIIVAKSTSTTVVDCIPEKQKSNENTSREKLDESKVSNVQLRTEENKLKPGSEEEKIPKLIELEFAPLQLSEDDDSDEETVPRLELTPDDNVVSSPDPEPQIEESLEEKSEFVETLRPLSSDTQDNLETMLAVASLQNIDIPKPDEPNISEKERREMEALAIAVQSITDTSSSSYEYIEPIIESESILQSNIEIKPLSQKEPESDIESHQCTSETDLLQKQCAMETDAVVQSMIESSEAQSQNPEKELKQLEQQSTAEAEHSTQDKTVEPSNQEEPVQEPIIETSDAVKHCFSEALQEPCVETSTVKEATPLVVHESEIEVAGAVQEPEIDSAPVSDSASVINIIPAEDIIFPVQLQENKELQKETIGTSEISEATTDIPSTTQSDVLIGDNSLGEKSDKTIESDQIETDNNLKQKAIESFEPVTTSDEIIVSEPAEALSSSQESSQDSVYSSTQNDVAKPFKEGKNKSFEKTKKHKKSEKTDKLEELTINVDVPDKERTYSPKITIKPIKVPDEEVSTTTTVTADSEVSKGSLKMTITKQSDNMHSILKVSDQDSSEVTTEAEAEPIPKLIIKPKMQQVEQQHSPKMSTRSSRHSPTSSNQRSSSPRITIKPVLKQDKLEPPVSPIKIKINTKVNSKVIKEEDITRKVLIKPLIKPSEELEQVSSPRITIKPIPKPESEKELHQIKPIMKANDESELVHSPRITIKPIPKPESEKEGNPRLTIKPLKKPDEDIENEDKEKCSPKITIKPIVKPADCDVSPSQQEDEEIKERIVLKINKGNLPTPMKEPKKREHLAEDDKSEKLAKITVKFSKEGGHPHIVHQQGEDLLSKRSHEESTLTEKNKKLKVEVDPPVFSRSRHKDPNDMSENKTNPVELKIKHKDHVLESQIEIKRARKDNLNDKLKHKDVDSTDDVHIIESKVDSPIIISEDSRSQDSGSVILLDDSKEDSLSSIDRVKTPDIYRSIQKAYVSGGESTTASPVPRKRGRPRKSSPSRDALIDRESTTPSPVPKKKLGRPRKNISPSGELPKEGELSAERELDTSPTKKKLGRPRKTLSPPKEKESFREAESSMEDIVEKELVAEMGSVSPSSVPKKKMGRPRKVPLEIREEAKFEELHKSKESDQPQQLHESGRPKRSCRGQSVCDTLGIKPRKPRGSGRGRGSVRGIGNRPLGDRDPSSFLDNVREEADVKNTHNSETVGEEKKNTEIRENAENKSTDIQESIKKFPATIEVIVIEDEGLPAKKRKTEKKIPANRKSLEKRTDIEVIEIDSDDSQLLGDTSILRHHTDNPHSKSEQSRRISEVDAAELEIKATALKSLAADNHLVKSSLIAKLGKTPSLEFNKQLSGIKSNQESCSTDFNKGPVIIEKVAVPKGKSETKKSLIDVAGAIPFSNLAPPAAPKHFLHLGTSMTSSQSSKSSNPEVPSVSKTIPSEVMLVDEETRMSAETNSRAQTPAKQVITSSDMVEESQSSVYSTGTTESGKTPSRPSKAPRLEVQETDNKVVTADHLTEYFWNGNGPFMLQEQVAQFLGIKSFKRKYPGLMRRMLDMQERDYIREQGLASEHMCDLGLTAVNAADILDIMYSDFQEKYEEYCKHQRDRQAKELISKQKALSLAATQEKCKADITEQAVHSAAQWNARFNKTRKEQRKTCMDLQNLTVHYPKGKMVPPVTVPHPGNYPVALVPGQFAEYYEEFTPTELNNLPINTMCYENVHFIPRDESEDSGSDGSDSDSESSDSSSSSSDSDSSSGIEDCKLCKHSPKKVNVTTSPPATVTQTVAATAK